jgi:hypothetical protein
MFMHPHTFPIIFMGPIGLVFLLVGFLIFALPVMEIVHKAGYSRIWILVWFVPLLNIIMLWVFAFSRWPNQGDHT